VTALQAVCEKLVADGADGALALVAIEGREDAAAAGAVGRGDRIRAGSVTKTALAALVLLLAEDGALGLDDPVEAWLNTPGSITIRDLLRHTSGLPDYTANPAFRDRFLRESDAAWGAEELIALAGPAALETGTFAYSNTNYIVAGLVAEAVAHAPLARLLAERVFEPLSIHDVELTGSVGMAAGGLVATAADIARFLRGLLMGELLTPTSLAEMLTTIPGDGVEFARYGLGIAEMDSFVALVACPCGTAWGHLGFLPDATCAALSTRDGRRQAVLVAADSVPEAFGEAMWEIFCEP
jgi:D-alanyl-D-alanine carboxypeptidase